MVNNEILIKIIERLTQEFKPEQIIMFGSYAHGNPDEKSDLDLMVIVNESYEKPIYRRIRALRSLIDIKNISFDIFVKTHDEAYRYRNVVGSMTNKIFKNGKVLYESERGINKKLASESFA